MFVSRRRQQALKLYQAVPRVTVQDQLRILRGHALRAAIPTKLLGTTAICSSSRLSCCLRQAQEGQACLRSSRPVHSQARTDSFIPQKVQASGTLGEKMCETKNQTAES